MEQRDMILEVMNYGPDPGQKGEAGDNDYGAPWPHTTLGPSSCQKIPVLCSFLIRSVQQKS